jgi:predicted nucleic acid-binding protein
VASIYLVDTNVLLRFLRDDHAIHSPAAKKLFDDARSGRIGLRIPFIAITETIFTLQTHYALDRADIGRELLKLLTAPGITLTCPAWILRAVEHYRDKNVSFGDACLAAEAEAEALTIASFDRGLSKFPAVKRYEPKERCRPFSL